jgi:hypothetical protein
MADKKIQLSRFPFNYAVHARDVPGWPPLHLRVLDDARIGETGYNLAVVESQNGDMDRTTPGVAYVLKHLLATRFMMLKTEYERQQGVGGLACIGAWLALFPLVHYAPVADGEVAPPLMLGFHHVQRDGAPYAQGGIPNADALAFVRNFGVPLLHTLCVTIPVKGSVDVRYLAQLELARDIAHDMFLASGDVKPDYMTTGMLLGEFKSGGGKGGKKANCTATWLVFPQRLAEVAAAILARVPEAQVDANTTRQVSLWPK